MTEKPVLNCDRFTLDLLDRLGWEGTLRYLKDSLANGDRRALVLNQILKLIEADKNAITFCGLENIIQALIDSHEQCLPEYNSRPCPSEEVLEQLKLLITNY